MLLCEYAEFVTWHPDMASSGGGRPRWTRIEAEGALLCNSVEWVDWTDDPVQVEICDACGHPECASGGYVRMVRLGDSIVWTRTSMEFEGDWEASQFTSLYALRKKGPIVFPAETWNGWRLRFADLPAPDRIPPMTRRDLELAWLLEFPLAMGLSSSRALPSLLRAKTIAAHPGEIDAAILNVEQICEWFEADPTREVTGCLRPVAGDPLLLAMEGLGSEAGGFRQWAPLVITDDGPAPLLGNLVVTS